MPPTNLALAKGARVSLQIRVTTSTSRAISSLAWLKENMGAQLHEAKIQFSIIANGRFTHGVKSSDKFPRFRLAVLHWNSAIQCAVAIQRAVVGECNVPAGSEHKLIDQIAGGKRQHSGCRCRSFASALVPTFVSDSSIVYPALPCRCAAVIGRSAACPVRWPSASAHWLPGDAGRYLASDQLEQEHVADKPPLLK